MGAPSGVHAQKHRAVLPMPCRLPVLPPEPVQPSQGREVWQRQQSFTWSVSEVGAAELKVEVLRGAQAPGENWEVPQSIPQDESQSSAGVYRLNK